MGSGGGGPSLTGSSYTPTGKPAISFAQMGGVVPGPTGQPRPAVVHGGELVVPTDQTSLLRAMLKGIASGTPSGNTGPTLVGQGLMRLLSKQTPMLRG